MSYFKKNFDMQLEVDENIPNNNQCIPDVDIYFKDCSDEVLFNSKSPQETKEFIPEGELKENIEDRIKEDGADEDFAGTDCKKKASAISDFEEADCGEPIVSQHLRIDFTPVAGFDDNEQVQKKCLDFWEFIHKQPQLQKFKVYPANKSDSTLTSGSEVRSEETDDLIKDMEINISTPALDWLTNKSVMKNALITKVGGKYCEDGDDDYSIRSRVQRERGNGENRRESNLSKVANRGDAKKFPAERISSPNDLKFLCYQMEEWDQTHPKSYDAPGHAPTVIHASMQRDISNIYM